ncbi:hypothetical protein LCGC14_1723960 [marine sediment metagenome]|uniref:Uncharacterized protein n=1 Tax=marine sediment metagenome TaxID=412755 RepID=A0A0F9HBB6_9ZZZZ
MERNKCPNCGKKGMIKGNIHIKKATHRCYYCDMEFEKTIRKGQVVWKGDRPAFTKAHKGENKE